MTNTASLNGHIRSTAADLVGNDSSRSVVRRRHKGNDEVFVCELYCVWELGVRLTPLVKDGERNGMDPVFALVSIH